MGFAFLFDDAGEIIVLEMATVSAVGGNIAGGHAGFTDPPGRLEMMSAWNTLNPLNRICTKPAFCPA
jgi:hypothetical protein